MSEITINELLVKIKNEIMKRAGHGFTLELNADITKYQVYLLKAPSLWDEFVKNKDEWTWKPYKTITNQKYLSTFFRRPDDVNNYDRIENVDWEISMSPQLQSQLPLGVSIQKTSVSVLYDGRDYRITWPQGDDRKKFFSTGPTNHHWRDLKHIRRLTTIDNNYHHEISGRETDYIEGRRVYITVSDEYASRIFNEVCNSEYPFRNYLLAKYDQILKDIAVAWNYLNFSNAGQGLLGFSGVSFRGAYESDYGYNWTSINYKDLGMANLNSYEQLYGMAIAIIDTKRKLDPIWQNARFSISNNRDNTSICIDVVVPPPELPKEPTIKLKEW